MREDEVDGGYVATALGHAIATQGETLEELRDMLDELEEREELEELEEDDELP